MKWLALRRSGLTGAEISLSSAWVIPPNFDSAHDCASLLVTMRWDRRRRNYNSSLVPIANKHRAFAKGVAKAAALGFGRMRMACQRGFRKRAPKARTPRGGMAGSERLVRQRY